MKISYALLGAGLVFASMIPVSFAAVPASSIVTDGVGELTVSTSDATLVGSIPQGATRVPMLTLNLSASCDADVTVSEIRVRHVGLGAVTDISGVYVANDIRRISRSTTFQRTGVATLRLRSFTIKKCGAERLQVLADFSRQAGVAAEHGITLRQPSDVVSSAKRTFLEQDAAGMPIATSPVNGGILTVKFLSTNARMTRYGRMETVARLQLSADAKSGHILRAITLTNDETARDMDLINVSLETTSGKTLTPLAQRLKGKQVTLRFEPTYILGPSQTVVLLLKAQINGSATRKINFLLEEESDLDAGPHRSRN